MPGSGREGIPNVWEWWEALPDILEWPRFPPRCPGVVGRPSLMYGSVERTSQMS